MRDEREKLDWREMSRTSYTCANPAYLASPTQLARHTFLASPARRASRAPCGRSSALSLTDPKSHAPHTMSATRGSAAPYSGSPSLSTFSRGTPDCTNCSSHAAACSRSVINTRSNCHRLIPSGEETGQERNDSRELPSMNPTQSIFISRSDR